MLFFSLLQEVPSDQPVEDVVGRPIPHLAATKQATGEAVYCDDIPKYAGMTHEPQVRYFFYTYFYTIDIKILLLTSIYMSSATTLISVKSTKLSLCDM